MISQDRFQFVGPYAMSLRNNGTLLANFNVLDTEIGIEFRDVRLVDGKNGVFVGVPSREYENKAGKMVRVDYWTAFYDQDAKERDALGSEYMEAMARAAYAFYEAMTKSTKGNSTSTARPRAASKTAPTRSARGPVSRPSTRDNAPAKAKSDGLPF